MGIISFLAKSVVYGSGLGAAGWYGYTHKSTCVPLPATAPIYQLKSFKAINPLGNQPVLSDEVLKVVAVADLRDDVKGDLNKLGLEFTRGVWSGLGLWYQRRYLSDKYRALEGRAQQLWDPEHLASSNYAVGTELLDHFNVVEHQTSKTGTMVAFRCGDSPLVSGPRASDGLFVISAKPTDSGAAVVFSLQSIFVNTTKEAQGSTAKMPAHIDFLHREYAKLWMETATRRLVK